MEGLGRTLVATLVLGFHTLPWPATILLATTPLDFNMHQCASKLPLDRMGI